MRSSAASAACSKSLARVAAKRRDARHRGELLEKRVALLFTRLGYWNVRRNVRVKDNFGNWSEVDVVAGAIPWLRVYVECKAHSPHRPIQLYQVAKFKEVLRLLGIPIRRGLVVGTARFSPRCSSVGLYLWTESDLESWEHRADRLQNIVRAPKWLLLLLVVLCTMAEWADEIGDGLDHGVEVLRAAAPGQDVERSWWETGARAASETVRRAGAWSRSAVRRGLRVGAEALPGGEKALDRISKALDALKEALGLRVAGAGDDGGKGGSLGVLGEAVERADLEARQGLAVLQAVLEQFTQWRYGNGGDGGGYERGYDGVDRGDVREAAGGQKTSPGPGPGPGEGAGGLDMDMGRADDCNSGAECDRGRCYHQSVCFVRPI